MYLESIPQILPMSIPLILSIVFFSILIVLTIFELSWYTKPKNKTKLKDKQTTFFLRLFVSFDPKTRIFIEINWIVILIRSIILVLRFWKKPSRLNLLIFFLTNIIKEQFKIALKRSKDARRRILVSLFLLILLINIIGLFPNIFTPRRHITINLTIAFPLWLGFLIFGWINFTNKILAHLVPNGTPIPLIRFIVLIEIIRNIIRSLTLSIRLIANIVSGHLLLTLIGNLIQSKGLIIISILTIIQSILTRLEIGVAFIQAYVFCILLTLYSNDSDL